MTRGRKALRDGTTDWVPVDVLLVSDVLAKAYSSLTKADEVSRKLARFGKSWQSIFFPT
jgi:hypothetical protein